MSLEPTEPEQQSSRSLKRRAPPVPKFDVPIEGQSPSKVLKEDAEKYKSEIESFFAEINAESNPPRPTLGPMPRTQAESQDDAKGPTNEKMDEEVSKDAKEAVQKIEPAAPKPKFSFEKLSSKMSNILENKKDKLDVIMKQAATVAASTTPAVEIPKKIVENKKGSLATKDREE